MIDLLHMQEKIDRFFAGCEDRSIEHARRSAYRHRLSEDEVHQIRERYANRHLNGETTEDIGRDFGVSRQTAGSVGRGSSYRYVK